MNKIEKIMRRHVQHYDERKYWKWRKEVINKESKIPKLIRIVRLYKIKRMDAFNGASFGTHLGYGATFKDVPHLPHGLRGIYVSHNAIIGHNCTIFHQVTIGEGKDGAPTIGDNCYIGAGAKVIRKN